MKNLLKLSLLALVATFAAYAQTTTPSTTLCAAITSTTANTICLTSITNVVGQTSLFVDGELMQAVGTPTNAFAVRVQRGVSSGSQPTTHATGALVWVGLTPGLSIVNGVNGFKSGANLAPPNGTCVRTSQVYLPIIYVNLGKPYDCDVNTSVWRAWNVVGPVVSALDTGAANAITSAVGTQPAYTGIIVQVTLAHALQAGADTFAYAGGTALNIKSSRNPANNIATAYVTGGVVNLELALVSSTLTWLDLSQ